MILSTKLSLLGLFLLLCRTSQAFDYNITSAGSLFLTDNSTGISGLQTIFTGDVTLVSVEGVEWGYTGLKGGNSSVTFTTLVDGVVQDEGTISLAGVGRELPTFFDCGSVLISQSELVARRHVYYDDTLKLSPPTQSCFLSQIFLFSFLMSFSIFSISTMNTRRHTHHRSHSRN
jgi:hypothetical protein